MFAPSPAVRPLAGGVHRRAAAAPSDASERASGKKRPRVAPARDSSSACLTKTTRNSVVTAAAAGEMSSQQLLKKRLASELDVLRGLLKKAELISQRAARKGGAPPPTARKKERFSASNQRPKLIDFNAPPAKRRKIPTPVRKNEKVAEASKNEKVAEESKDAKLAEESKGEVVREKEAEEYADISIGLSYFSGDSSDTKMVQQSTQAKKVQNAQKRAAPKAVDMSGLLYRANLRRQMLEMERAALKYQSIHPRDLQHLGINEYGHPSIMRQLGLVVKVVEA